LEHEEKSQKRNRPTRKELAGAELKEVRNDTSISRTKLSTHFQNKIFFLSSVLFLFIKLLYMISSSFPSSSVQQLSSSSFSFFFLAFSILTFMQRVMSLHPFRSGLVIFFLPIFDVIQCNGPFLSKHSSVFSSIKREFNLKSLMA
jgi:hypothetical protein